MPNFKNHNYHMENGHLLTISRFIVKWLLLPVLFLFYCPVPVDAHNVPFSPRLTFSRDRPSAALRPPGTSDFSDACKSTSMPMPPEVYYKSDMDTGPEVREHQCIQEKAGFPFISYEPELAERDSLILGRSRGGYLFTTEGANSARLQSQTGLLLGMGIAAVGVLSAMPEEYTGWDKEGVTLQSMLQRWWDNVSSGPVWDTDDWATNYIGHAYAGLVYYQIARSSDYSMRDSFVYTALMSTFAWEYGFEAFAETPSIQDLIYTPLAGMLFGEAAYSAEKAIMANDYQFLGSREVGYVSAFLLNPVSYVAQGINLLVGREWLITGDIKVFRPSLRNIGTGETGQVSISPQMNLLLYRKF